MLSERIYQFRRNSGLSQEQLAEKIGVSRQAISKWESGISTPELEKLLALSECFDITIDELVKDEAFTQGTNEVPQELEKTKDPKAIEMKVGIGLCLVGCYLSDPVRSYDGFGVQAQRNSLMLLQQLL